MSLSGRLCKGKDKLVCGVCSGLGNYLGIDPNLIRLITIVLFLISPSVAVIAYFLACAILPDYKEGKCVVSKYRPLSEYLRRLSSELSEESIKYLIALVGIAMIIAGAIYSLTPVITGPQAITGASFLIPLLTHSLGGLALIIAGAAVVFVASKVGHHVQSSEEG